MMAFQEDDWEVDINLGSDHNVFQRKGIFNYEPDKELALACERYQYPTPYFDEDDDIDSSVASSSIISSRYSELSLHNLDDFMYDESPVETIIPNNQNLPGMIKRLGCKKQAQDNDDWNDDIEIPTRVSFVSPKKIYDQINFDDDDDDDIGPSVSQRGSQVQPSFTYQEEQEEQDEMSGLDFPENLSGLSRKLDEKKRLNPERPCFIPKANVEKPKFFAKIQRENDDDDFCDGLDIKDKVFKTSAYPSKLPTLQSRSTPPGSTSKGKVATGNFVSRLARPTTFNKSSTDTTKKPLLQQRQMPTIRRNYLANTHATMHREAETTAKRTPQFYKQQKPTATRQTQPLGMHPSVSRNSETTTFERKSANNYTLITKPKTKVATGYCSQLDNLDNLNDLRSSIPARKIGFRYTRPDTKAEPERPWRRHTQSSKVKLIQPNEQNLKKEYNDMKYDDRTHSWKGNESSLIEFQEKRRPRLMLMTNKQQKPSKYAAAVGNHMIFHAESQKWVSAFGISEECNELDQIEDLNEEMRQIPQRTTQCANKMLEFKLSVETKRQMMYEQEQHEAWIKHWPLKSEEAQITTCSGQLVGASKYCLFRPFE